MTLGRYPGIYAALWKNSVAREMGFKSNFILWIFVEMLWFALQLGFFTVIYQHTDNIAGWTKWEVVLLVGASHFIQQLFTAFFLTNCTHLSELIRTGKLDFMLLLPINTRFLVSLRQVDLGGFINAASAMGVMIYAARELHLHPGALQITAFLAMTIAGVTLHYCLMLALACTSFFTVRAQGIVFGYYNLFNIARMPDGTFHGAFKAFFTFVLPMVLVANVPAKTLISRFFNLGDICMMLGMTLVWLSLSEMIWRASVKRYTSASS